MASYKVGFYWNQSVMGVGEQYISRDTNPVGLVPLVQSLITARNGMLWFNQFWVGVRIGEFGAKRRSVVLLPGTSVLPGSGLSLNIPIAGANPYQVIKGGRYPDQLRATLQYALTFDATRVANRYLSGISDYGSFTEPASFEAGWDPAWMSAFNAFGSRLVSDGWMVNAVDKTIPNVKVRFLIKSTTAPNYLGIGYLSADAGASAITAGKRVHLGGFRPPKGTRGPTVNGTWFVDTLDTTVRTGYTTAFLRDSQALNPDQMRITDQTAITAVGFALQAIQDFRAVRVGIHKRGRPSLAPHGRRLSRPTLDP